MDPRVLNPDAGRAPDNRGSAVYPVWMDGVFVASASQVMIGDPVTIPLSGTVRIGANPRRWAVGFLLASPLSADLRVSPFPQPDQFALDVYSLNRTIYWTLFTHGPLVTGEIYVYSSAGATFRLLEIEV